MRFQEDSKSRKKLGSGSYSAKCFIHFLLTGAEIKILIILV